MNLDNDGTGDESTLVKMRPTNSEFLDLDAKIGNCSLIDCISRNLIMIIAL